MTKWINGRIIVGLLIALLGLALALNGFIMYTTKIIKNDGLKYKKTSGIINQIEEDTVVVEYGVGEYGHYGILDYKGATDESIGKFINFYYHEDDPHNITFANYKEMLVQAIIDLVAFILGIIAIVYILRKRYTLAKDSHRVNVELLGIDKKSLVYIDKTEDSNPVKLYYTKPYFFENDYKELVENGKTNATLIVANKNSKWWSIDYQELKEALK